MVAVPFDSGDLMPLGSSTVLFEVAYQRAINSQRQYHVAPDGRFLMLKPLPDADVAPPQLQVTVFKNWFQELAERVPVD